MQAPLWCAGTAQEAGGQDHVCRVRTDVLGLEAGAGLLGDLAKDCKQTRAHVTGLQKHKLRQPVSALPEVTMGGE